MFQFIERFFRKKAINKSTANKIDRAFPNLDKPLSIIILLNNNKAEEIKDIQYLVNRLFKINNLHFIQIDPQAKAPAVVSVLLDCLGKNDFNFFGLLNDAGRGKIDNLRCDMFIDLSEMEKNDLLKEYVVSYIRSSFNITLADKEKPAFDMVVDTNDETDTLKKLTFIHDYLLKLFGK